LSIVLTVIPLIGHFGARLSLVTEVNFQPYLGQRSVLEETPSPLTDPMERHAAVNCPTAMSVEERLTHTAVTSVDSIMLADRASPV
jgi:hypothetical protein